MSDGEGLEEQGCREDGKGTGDRWTVWRAWGRAASVVPPPSLHRSITAPRGLTAPPRALPVPADLRSSSAVVPALQTETESQGGSSSPILHSWQVLGPDPSSGPTSLGLESAPGSSLGSTQPLGWVVPEPFASEPI